MCLAQALFLSPPVSPQSPPGMEIAGWDKVGSPFLSPEKCARAFSLLSQQETNKAAKAHPSSQVHKNLLSRTECKREGRIVQVLVYGIGCCRLLQPQNWRVSIEVAWHSTKHSFSPRWRPRKASPEQTVTGSQVIMICSL